MSGVSRTQGACALYRAGIYPQGSELAFETQEDRQIDVAAWTSDMVRDDLQRPLNVGNANWCVLHVVRAGAALIAAHTLGGTGRKLPDRL